MSTITISSAASFKEAKQPGNISCSSRTIMHRLSFRPCAGWACAASFNARSSRSRSDGCAARDFPFWPVLPVVVVRRRWSGLSAACPREVSLFRVASRLPSTCSSPGSKRLAASNRAWAASKLDSSDIATPARLSKVGSRGSLSSALKAAAAMFASRGVRRLGEAPAPAASPPSSRLRVAHWRRWGSAIVGSSARSLPYPPKSPAASSFWAREINRTAGAAASIASVLAGAASASIASVLVGAASASIGSVLAGAASASIGSVLVGAAAASVGSVSVGAVIYTLGDRPALAIPERVG